MTENEMKEPAELEALLPWHAAGALSRREAALVDEALASDAALRRQFAVIREELDEAIRLNENLGAPSPRVFAQLMARIDAEGAQARRGFSFDIGGWLAERLSEFSPRTLAWSAAAAALAIVLQAGLLVGMFVGEGGRGAFQTASYTGESARGAAGHALIAFAPEATATEIAAFLQAHKASIVEGPRAGGLYKVRINAPEQTKDDVRRVIADMQKSKTVRFAAPSE